MNRVISKVGNAIYRGIGYYPTTINGLNFRCDPFHISFWRKVMQGKWEENHIFDSLNKLLNPESIYIDIGSWIGPTVIYAAKLAKQIICFEPDYIAYRHLIWNIEINKLGNVIPFNIALSDKTGIQKMASFAGALGDSTTSLLKTQDFTTQIDAYCVNWTEWVDHFGLTNVDVIKIDIEGGEFSLFPIMKPFLIRYKPTIHLSLHAPYLPDEDRKRRVSELYDIVGIYNKCFDHQFKPVIFKNTMDDIILNGFPTYILMD